MIGKDEASKYDILEYAQTHFNFERVKKRTIRTLGRKKGDFSISEILCYSKVRTSLVCRRACPRMLLLSDSPP